MDNHRVHKHSTYVDGIISVKTMFYAAVRSLLHLRTANFEMTAIYTQQDGGLALTSLRHVLSGKPELSSSKATSYLGEILANALTNLCTSSYPTFLSLHSTTTNLTTTLSSFLDTLTTLLEGIPALESAARSFSSDISSIQSSRRRAALTSSKLPVLTDACVRAGHFQEALDLAAHAARLAARFPHVQAVQDVHAEADSSIRALFAQLLATLRAQGKLPTLFRAVSFLRRMRVLPEGALALAFLTGRLEALNAALTNAEGERRELDAPDAWARYMKKYVDTWREGVHDLVTQYATIFLERPPADLAWEDLDVLRALLPACASQLLSRLLDALRTALPRLSDAPALTALLTQLTYCSTSFVRPGLDFRTLLPPLFEDAVRVRASGKTPRTSWAGVGVPRRDSQAVAGTTALVFQMPPQALVTYPPVAVFANAILAALNGLRLLAPVALLNDLVQALDSALAQACRALLDAPSEEAHEAATAFVGLLVPFLRRGLIEGVYGSSEGDVMPSEGLQGVMEEVNVWITDLGQRQMK
ncbi:Dor1-domain-containing protein [Lactarius psammicola]|nr:Dor1-domain-containing protein [Lactarius psammicola]